MLKIQKIAPVAGKDIYKKDIYLTDQLLDLARVIAGQPQIPTVIYGETGTGKEIFVRQVHYVRQQAQGKIPFVAVNCSHLNSDVVDSMLFGHRKGSFTGADRTTNGLVGDANGGILFLDEVQDLSLETQKKLLRVLNDSSYSRVGESQMLHSSFQTIVATTRNIPQLVQEGKFLEDLEMRLIGFNVSLKPLRERPEEIPHFVSRFLEKEQVLLEPHELNQIVQFCQGFQWRGNVRSLVKRLQMAHLYAQMNDTSILTELSQILSEDQRQIRKPQAQKSDLRTSLDEFEKAYLDHFMTTHKGIGQSELATILGITKKTLYNKLKKYDILTSSK